MQTLLEAPCHNSPLSLMALCWSLDIRACGRTLTRSHLQDLLSLLRPNLHRFTTLEEACSAAAALEAQEEGGLEAIEEVPSDEEDGESGSEMGHDGRGRLCDGNSKGLLQ